MKRPSEPHRTAWSRELAFVDAGDPTNLSLISGAAFGEVVAPQGSATTAFTADGTGAAMPVIFQANLVYTFDVASGQRVVRPWRLAEADALVPPSDAAAAANELTLLDDG